MDKLVGLGYFVRVFDVLSTGKLDNIQRHLDSGKAEFVKGRVTIIQDVEKVVKGIDYVFHLAAQTSVPFSITHPSYTFNVNVSGTVNMLRVCHKAKVKKFVFGSSCAVYGDPYHLPISEDEPKDPISPYAESKQAGEHFCVGFYKTGMLKTALLRFFNVYGPRSPLNNYSGVITRFIDNSRKGEPLVVYGDGCQTRDFVYVSDVVDALVSCLDDWKCDGEIFNVGSGKPTTILDLAKAVVELTGSKSVIKNENERKGDIKDSYADISKAKKMLRYSPKVTFKEGLKCQIESVSN